MIRLSRSIWKQITERGADGSQDVSRRTSSMAMQQNFRIAKFIVLQCDVKGFLVLCLSVVMTGAKAFSQCWRVGTEGESVESLEHWKQVVIGHEKESVPVRFAASGQPAECSGEFQNECREGRLLHGFEVYVTCRLGFFLGVVAGFRFRVCRLLSIFQ